jgi:hypothetical protein
MRAALSEVATDVHQHKQTGLLSVSVKGSNSLFKIYFRNGDIYHISHGASKGNDCLAGLAEREFSECTFVPDIRLEINGTKLPPTGEVLRVLRGAAKGVEARMEGHGNGGSAEVLSKERFAAIAERMKAALVRQIGPVGGKVFSKIADGKWNASSPPSREDLIALVKMLKEEIEDLDDRNEFIREVSLIIS